LFEYQFIKKEEASLKFHFLE